MEIIEHEPTMQPGWGRLVKSLPLPRGDEWVNVLLVQLLVATLLLRLLWLAQPQGSLVFDESYYVNAARVMLDLPRAEGSFYYDRVAGKDPNEEHLPLAKVMIAGSMRVFGDNAFGWRVPSVLFGTAAVGMLFLLVRRLTRRPWVALFAAFIFSFDNLVFVHGRIATLDIFMLAFMLAGLYAYVAERPAVAGAALAFSTLAKFNGVFALLAIAGLEVLRFALRPEYRPRLRRTLADLMLLLGSFIVVFMAVLWPLDRMWTRFDNPLEHVAHVYQYGINLRRDGGPLGIESLPWQWLVNEVRIPYFKEDITVYVDGRVIGSRPIVAFFGQMNPFVIALLPMTLAYLLHTALTKREDFAFLMLTAFAATYLPPLAAAVFAQRISYIFYFLPVLAPLAAGIAYLLLDLKLPRIVPLSYAASVLLGFAVLFPFRDLI